MQSLWIEGFRSLQRLLSLSSRRRHVNRRLCTECFLQPTLFLGLRNLLLIGSNSGKFKEIKIYMLNGACHGSLNDATGMHELEGNFYFKEINQ